MQLGQNVGEDAIARRAGNQAMKITVEPHEVFRCALGERCFGLHERFSQARNLV